MQEIDNLAREARNAYFREWRANNKDKVKAINKRYWENRVKVKVTRELEENKNDR